MIDIDNQTDIWSQTKYKDIKLDLKIVKAKYFDLVWSSFMEMGIYDKFMDGNSIESLPRNNDSENMNGPKFSNAFHELNNKNQISPGLYLAYILNQFMDDGYKKDLLTGYLSRGLRSFASFMREPDLAYKLKTELEKDDKSVVVNMDPKQDIKKHVDIVINFKEHTFNLWSYQASKRGLPNTLDRLSGNRGEVCDGINILCPLRTEDAKNLVKKKTSIFKKRERIKGWSEERNQNPINSRLIRLNELIEKNSAKATEMIDELNDLYNLLSKEIIIKNGWFLHAPGYITSVKEIMDKCLNNEENFMKYKDLQNIILGPENFVKNINLFTK